MEKITLKEVRVYAESLTNLKDWEKDVAILRKLTEEEVRYLNHVHLYSTSDYKHLYDVELEFDLEGQGVLTATCYDHDAMTEFVKLAENKYYELNDDWSEEFEQWRVENHPKAVMTFEVPLTRGYSDTSRRDDTTFSSLDLEMAVTEYLDEYHKCGKIYPWQIRELVSANELGITEEELESELEVFLA